MQNSDTILIYEKPKAYFFPRYQGMIFAPFSIPHISLRYVLYKIMYLLHLPGYSIFWGKWKKAVKNAKQVIIFDYGYQRGMEKYIKRVNPDCQVSLFFWNIVNPYNRKHLRFSIPDAIYSTDKEDCKKYHLKYQHIFYPIEMHTQNVPLPCGHRMLFIGNDKQRTAYIVRISKSIEECNVECDIRIIRSSMEYVPYKEQYDPYMIRKRIPYQEYLSLFPNYDILLDVVQRGQAALTMRVMEAIFFSKKLITNNQHIREYSFYHPNNIFVLDEIESPTMAELLPFLSAPFVPYPQEVLEEYSFTNFVQGFMPEKE